MNESNFKQNIDKFISDGGIYIGVSAVVYQFLENMKTI